MSISSCPRCTQQVTLPMGVSTSAQVRCPLCRAEYTLADALVNMPPLLEVIGERTLEPAGDWFDVPSGESNASSSLAAPGAVDESAADFGLEPELASTEDPSDDLDLEDDLKFEAVEIEHDDIAVEQQDTEIEEIAFAPIDQLAGKTPPHVADESVPGADDDSLDFCQPLEASAEPPAADFVFGEGVLEQPVLGEANRVAEDEADVEIDLGDALGDESSADHHASDLDAELGFDASQEPAAASDDLAIDFGDPQSMSDQANEATLEFAQPTDALDDEPALDFSETSDAPADGEMALDFGEAVVADNPPPGSEANQAQADGDKKSKKKEKKEKKSRLIKPPDDAPRKRSLVGMLITVVLPAIVAIPVALYAALWISPDYDLLGMGPSLAGYGLVPSSFNKRTNLVAQTPSAPSFQLPQLPPRTPMPSGDPGGEPEASPADAPPANEPAADEAVPSTTPAPAEKTQEPATTSAPAGDDPEGAAAPPAPLAADAGLPDADTPETATPEPSVPVANPAEPTVGPKDDSLDALLKDSAEEKEMPAEKARVVEDLPDPAAPATSDESPVLPAAQAPGSDEKQQAIVPDEALGPRDARESNPVEVAKAVQSFSQADQRMSAVLAGQDKTELKKVRAGYYLSLYGLADRLALAKDNSADGQLDAERQSVERLALALAGDASRLGELKAYGAKWLAFTKRTTPGIVVAGTVQSSERIGPLYHVQIGMAADSPPVTIVSAVDPRVEALDEILALGSIVERPDEQLAGYKGDDAVVVWSGMTLKLPGK